MTNFNTEAIDTMMTISLGITGQCVTEDLVPLWVSRWLWIDMHSIFVSIASGNYWSHMQGSFGRTFKHVFDI